jgi:hypothetical protein
MRIASSLNLKQTQTMTYQHHYEFIQEEETNHHSKRLKPCKNYTQQHKHFWWLIPSVLKKLLERKKWIRTVKEEMQAIEENNT